MVSKPKKWLLLIPLALGIAAVVFLRQHKQPPVQAEHREMAKRVQTLVVTPRTITPLVSGYGTVMPEHSWEAVAQVKGKIITKNPHLQKGAILEAGTELLRIDPTDYELAIAQTEADIQAVNAQLQELQTKEKNTRASLAIEQNALKLSHKELERKRSLIGKGGISHSDLETQERSLLAQQQSVQGQKNALNLIPSERALLQAQLARDEVQLKTAQRNLQHTHITLPIAGRISAVNIERDQYVREGEVLAKADDLGSAEIEVQIPIDQMAALFHAKQPLNILAQEEVLNGISEQIKAEVFLKEGSLQASWQARFSRLSDTLDTKTRTVGVIVKVEHPYDNVQPGVRPPLVKGLFVEVQLQGVPRHDSLVIPRAALHGNTIYLIGEDQHLQIRPVEISLTQPDSVVISRGLKAGERIVTSDLVPAVEGMLLTTGDSHQVATVTDKTGSKVD